LPDAKALRHRNAERRPETLPEPAAAITKTLIKGLIMTSTHFHARRIAMALALSLISPLGAAAVDTPATADAPDLTTVRAKIKAKEFAAARDELFKLVNTHEHADVFNLLGFSLRKTGDYKNALTYYKKALDYDPKHKGAHEYLGELYVETKQPEKAKEHLAILVTLCPQGCEEREDLEKAIAAGAAAPKS
jgi:tetratricopeptide (TPR) repeat protein